MDNMLTQSTELTIVAVGYAGMMSPYVAARMSQIAPNLTARFDQMRVLGAANVPKGSVIQMYWPPNRGFWGKPTTVSLKPGTLVDRYGFEGGTFVAPKGVPFNMRSLEPGSELKPYNVYRVLQPIEVKAGQTAPWFYQPGGGVQYELPKSVNELLRLGILERVIP